MSFSLSTGAVLYALIVDICNHLSNSCTGVDKLKISNGREDWCWQTPFLYWQGEQKSFVLGAYVAAVIAGINTLSTIASKSHVLFEITHCSYVIPQFMFGSAHKCFISCLWFCLCNLVQELQLVAPRTYQFLSVYPPGYFLPSVLMLILVPSKTSRAFSSPVGFMTSHDFEAFGLHANLEPF